MISPTMITKPVGLRCPGGVESGSPSRLALSWHSGCSS